MSTLKKTLVFRHGLCHSLSGSERHADDMQQACVDWGRSVASALESKPNYWIPREVLVAENDDDVRGDGEYMVKQLYCLVKEFVEAEGDSWAGAEYWAQVYKGGRGLAFHVDKDEYAMKHRREMINPMYSSVLYLTGTAALQSPTVITNEHYDEVARKMVPEDFPTESTIVFPRENRYCMFDGRCGHGVLDTNSNDDDVRVTFLVNWWKERPEEVHRCPGKPISSSLTVEELKQRREETNKREPVLELSVTKGYLFGNEPFMMDEFFQSHGILDPDDVRKGKSRPIIRMRHAGIVMIPLSQLEEGQEKPLMEGALVSQEYQKLLMELQ
jgi:hypothetical protein